MQTLGSARVVAGLTTFTGGPSDAPLVLCLHGFPDVPQTYHALAPKLLRAGYRVATPYLPGYAPSPRLRRADLDEVARALADLAHALCPTRPHVVIGHDWGGALAYTLTARDPSRISALVSMAVPHPAAFARTWISSSAQRRASAYMLAFQLPMADAALLAGQAQMVRRLWRRWSPGLSPDPQHMERVVRCLAASAGAPLDYYRHNLRPLLPALRRLRRLSRAPWRTPTLHLHGADDGCMRPSCALASQRLLGDVGRVEVLDDAGHFLHLERPEEVADRVLSFLAATGP